jgi:hypothetical protein
MLRNKSRATKTPVPIKPPPSNAHRVRNARGSPPKVGVLDLARWIGRPRTGNAAHRKASASSKLPVEEAAVVGADAEEAGDAAAAAGGGGKQAIGEEQ